MRVRVTDELVVEVKRTHIGVVSVLGAEVVDLLAKKLGLTDVSEQHDLFNKGNILTFRSLDDEIKSLELSVAWIKHYIPLIKEVIMYKRNNMPSLSTPAPVILAGDSVDPKTIKKSIEKAVKECKW